MKIESFGASDVGLIRLNNEDVWAQIPTLKCFLLADGMGGHRAGEVAASETILYLCRKIKETAKRAPSLDEWPEIIRHCIQKANEWVYNLAITDKDKEGMGTTLCLALQLDHTLLYAHVGDSRIYRIRKGRITPLTRDHSLRSDLIAKGELDEALAPSFPLKNVITRAIGTQKMVTPEIKTCPVESEDLFLLCSDGLTDPLGDEMILATIEENETLEEMTNDLIFKAKTSGGDDNITLVFFRVTD
ncbi:MAG: putative protein phosphatase 2C-type [Chlamydiae bacterium]|nr:putative protein phosphatase 2C-type [Chlamydiota bacterium]